MKANIIAQEGLTWQTVKVENWPNMNSEGNTVAKQNNENL